MKIKRILLSVLALALVAALSVGATLAFMSAEDTRVINNFSFGSISVKIEEEVPTNLPGEVEANNRMTFVDNAFESVTVSSTCTGSETLSPVYIDVFAIQYDNISFADACAAAAASFAAEAAPAPTPAP